ncbi:MAG: hypothetical protein Q9227_003457 [Pyrenula ochraceoflavens]
MTRLEQMLFSIRGLRPLRPPSSLALGVRHASRLQRRKPVVGRPVPPALGNQRTPPSTARRTNPSEPSSENASPEQDAQSGPPAPPAPPSFAESLAAAKPEDNSLIAPVHIPEDAHAVLKSDHPSTSIIANSGIVVQRQFEMLNIFLGFEQANRYVILDPQGNHIGYMAEHDGGIGKSLGRQMFRTHRAFTTNIFDRSGREVLRFHRPFAYINSRIRIYDPCTPTEETATYPESQPADPSTPNTNIPSPLPLSSMRIIGETHQQWAPLRRKYNLFLYHQSPNIPSRPSSLPSPSDLSPSQQSQLALAPVQNGIPSQDGTFAQFAYVDSPFLSWDFALQTADNRLLGSVNRNFAGFGRELFTDTGVYALRMDSAASAADAAEGGKESILGSVDGMTLDQRAVMLATAVSIDFDYFSRHSSGFGGLPIPLWLPFGGAEGAAGAEAGEYGAVVGGTGEGAEGIAGGAAAGAGTMAGYEAMQRGMGRDGEQSDGDMGQSPPPEGQVGQGEDVWGEDQEQDDPWGNDDNNDHGGDGGGDGGDFGDFF